MERRVAVLVGSLRREAWSGKVARTLIKLSPPELKMEIVEIGQLPIYNQDYDDGGNPPPEYIDFRERIRSFDAVLFVTPEHNRSVPAALKNALDVGSRPHGANAWNGKPAAVVSVTPGMLGGLAANLSLRSSLVFVNLAAMAQPEAYIGRVRTLFDQQGNLTADDTRTFFHNFLDAFQKWIETILT